MWALKKIGSRAMKILSEKNDNDLEISFFDVKELYDAAYAEKARTRVNLRRFKVLMDKATQLDEAYRAQLEAAKMARYEEVA